MDGATRQRSKTAAAEAVAKVIYTGNALDDIERAFEFLARRDSYRARAAVAAIRSAVDVLADHPFIGPSMDGPLRELVISFGKTGYLALYRFRAERDEIKVLAIRHQRELDYLG